MRFAHAHKVATYLMVSCAALALILSGELDGLVVTGALAGIIGSWWWEPPRIRFERFSRAWTVASALVLAYAIFSLVIGSDPLLIGGHFLLYLLVAKLFSRRACKDYQQVYVLSFLMLVAGTVLNAEFTYGVFFLGYVVSATWALILFHLRREMEDNFLLKHADVQSSERVEVARILNSRRIVGGKFFVGTSLVSLTIFLVASLLFLAIPRIGFGLFFQKSRGGLQMAGFSDGVQLGGHGVIKTDNTVVMRVKVDEPYRGRDAPYLHWRGVAFDHYSGGEWRRSQHAPTTQQEVAAGGDRRRHFLRYDDARVRAPVLAVRAEAGMRQTVYLEPTGYDVVFGASMPLAFEFDVKLGHSPPRTAQNDELRMRNSVGVAYTVLSQTERPAPERLRAAPRELPPGYDVYLQIPPEVPERVRALALDITRDAETDYDKVVALERWLQRELGYTLNMVAPPRGQEPLDFFLFDRRKGHCEYFSTALAIMARAVGVPTRNVNGFLGGEWNSVSNYIAVRAGDAHSWVEVYFAGAGWVTFDPTPPGQVDQLGRGSGGLRNRMRRTVDSLRFKWFRWVIEYDLHRQMSLFRDVGSRVRGSTEGVKRRLTAARDWLGRHKLHAAGAVGAPLAVVLLVVLLRRRAAAGAGAGQRRRRDRGRIAALYASALRRLARRGFGRAAHITPREHARALLEQGAPGAAALAELAEIYYAAEYGDAVSPELERRAAQLEDDIDAALRKPRAPTEK